MKDSKLREIAKTLSELVPTKRGEADIYEYLLENPNEIPKAKEWIVELTKDNKEKVKFT